MARWRKRRANHLPPIGPCGKRSYGSKGAARKANRGAGWRIKPYWCDECNAWHVSNNEKR